MTSIRLLFALLENMLRYVCCKSWDEVEVAKFLDSPEGYDLRVGFYRTRMNAATFAAKRLVHAQGTDYWRTHAGRQVLRRHWLAHLRLLNATSRPADLYAGALAMMIDHGYWEDDNKLHHFLLPDSPIRIVVRVD